MLKRATQLLALAVGIPILHWIWKLIENAALGWADDQLAQWLGIEAPTPAYVLKLLVDWGIPVSAMILLLYSYHTMWERLNRHQTSEAPGHPENAQETLKAREVYLTPNRVMHYMAEESEWGAAKSREKSPEGLSYNVLLEAPLEFQRKASEGSVRVYGLHAESKTGHELIDKTHWMSCGLRLETLFKPPFENSSTWPTVIDWPRRLQLYSYLRVQAEDVYRTWPRRPDQFVSMPEAVTAAYEQLRAADSDWARVADRFAGSSLGRTRNEGTLLYMATAFTTQGAPLYGKFGPSRIREKIDPDEFKRGGFKDSGATFCYHASKEPRYTDIAIQRLDLEALIEQMKRDSSLAA